MTDTLQAQIGAYLSRLEDLIRRGHDLRALLVANPSDAFAVTATRVWQQDCGVTINELSGGSKAHWLARSFSDAFLLRSKAGQAAEEAAPEEIVQRLVEVLERAAASLSAMEAGSAVMSSEQPAPRRFEFVHNTELRPVLEQAYTESRRAFDGGKYDLALQTSCGILEAIVTDALEHKGLSAMAPEGVPPEKIADWSFQTRIAVAERAGLIGGGCTRLPATAWAYRDQAAGGATGNTSERDARLASQVLRVVMRDLDPGR